MGGVALLLGLESGGVTGALHLPSTRSLGVRTAVAWPRGAAPHPHGPQPRAADPRRGPSAAPLALSLRHTPSPFLLERPSPVGVSAPSPVGVPCAGSYAG